MYVIRDVKNRYKLTIMFMYLSQEIYVTNNFRILALVSASVWLLWECRKYAMAFLNEVNAV